MPTFDGETAFNVDWSIAEFVRRYTGIRCYRPMVLIGEQQPADIISVNDPLGVRIAKAAGLALPDAADLAYPLASEVACKHVLCRGLSWELASKAERITYGPERCKSSYSPTGSTK